MRSTQLDWPGTGDRHRNLVGEEGGRKPFAGLSARFSLQCTSSRQNNCGDPHLFCLGCLQHTCAQTVSTHHACITPLLSLSESCAFSRNSSLVESRCFSFSTSGDSARCPRARLIMGRSRSRRRRNSSRSNSSRSVSHPRRRRSRSRSHRRRRRRSRSPPAAFAPPPMSALGPPGGTTAPPECTPGGMGGGSVEEFLAAFGASDPTLGGTGPFPSLVFQCGGMWQLLGSFAIAYAVGESCFGRPFCVWGFVQTSGGSTRMS